MQVQNTFSSPVDETLIIRYWDFPISEFRKTKAIVGILYHLVRNETEILNISTGNVEILLDSSRIKINRVLTFMKIFVSNALSLITSQQLHASSMIAIYLVDIKTDRIFDLQI